MLWAVLNYLDAVLLSIALPHVVAMNTNLSVPIAMLVKNEYKRMIRVLYMPDAGSACHCMVNP